MHNLFYNNALLSNLQALVGKLPDQEDKEAIGKIIRKQLAVNTKYNYPLSELAKITRREASCHSIGVSKCRYFASDYMLSVYNIDVDGREELEDYGCSEIWVSEYYNELNSMMDDFQITRSYMYKTLPADIKAETVDAFDLYVTNIFIEKYIQISKQHKLL